MSCLGRSQVIQVWIALVALASLPGVSASCERWQRCDWRLWVSIAAATFALMVISAVSAVLIYRCRARRRGSSVSAAVPMRWLVSQHQGTTLRTTDISRTPTVKPGVQWTDFHEGDKSMPQKSVNNWTSQLLQQPVVAFPAAPTVGSGLDIFSSEDMRVWSRDRSDFTIIMSHGDGPYGHKLQATHHTNQASIDKRSRFASHVTAHRLHEPSNEKTRRDFLWDAYLLTQCSHPNILRLLGLNIKKTPWFMYQEVPCVHFLSTDNLPSIRHLVISAMC